MKSKLQVGDRVRVRGVRQHSIDYDEGRILNLTPNGCRVYWELAREIYDEALEELERLP